MNNTQVKALQWAKENILSAWLGHQDFATWLVQRVKAKTIVDLGIDYGFSSVVMANAAPEAVVYAVDFFLGCENDSRGKNPKEEAIKNIQYVKDNFNINNIELVVKDFNVFVKKWPAELEIDVLHIDGWHDYEYVKKDFENWLTFVKKDGIILLHDVNYFPEGADKYFAEIKLPKFKFLHSYGLGVVCRNANLLENLLNEWNEINQ